jgi:hypothetical protein
MALSPALDDTFEVGVTLSRSSIASNMSVAPSARCRPGSQLLSARADHSLAFTDFDRRICAAL